MKAPKASVSSIVPKSDTPLNLPEPQKPPNPGAFLIPNHLSTQVKVFPVSEDQLDALGDLNLIANVFLSLSMLAAGVYTSCIWPILFTQEVPLAGVGYAWAWGVASVVFAGVSALCFCRRHGRLKALKARSIETNLTIKAEHTSR